MHRAPTAACTHARTHAHTQHTNHLLDLVLVIIGPVLQVDSASLETLIGGVLHSSSPDIRGAELKELIIMHLLIVSRWQWAFCNILQCGADLMKPTEVCLWLEVCTIWQHLPCATACQPGHFYNDQSAILIPASSSLRN